MYRGRPGSSSIFERSRLTAVARLQADAGQTMVEYGLSLALVSIVAISILTTLGGNLQSTFTSAAGAL